MYISHVHENKIYHSKKKSKKVLKCLKLFKNFKFFHFRLNRSLVYGNPTIFLLAINCKKKKCSIFNALGVTLKSSNALRRSCSDDFYVFVTPRVLMIEFFFFLQLIANKKNNRGYHIPMIDLGENEKDTAVLKLF